jgi:hypothetical protein
MPAHFFADLPRTFARRDEGPAALFANSPIVLVLVLDTRSRVADATAMQVWSFHWLTAVFHPLSIWGNQFVDWPNRGPEAMGWKGTRYLTTKSWTFTA